MNLLIYCIGLMLVCFATLSSFAMGATALDFQAIPPLISNPAKPLVMLVLSNDHELFKKAYSDYSDLDGDGLLDTSYKDSIEYYGYFNVDKCYNYNSLEARFQPGEKVIANSHRCHIFSARWSGNFLNWATMTRIDVVRKILYGGKRSVDSQTSTVLERAFIPNDVHAFVKIFSGSVSDFTPFDNSSISMCNTTAYNPASDGQSVSRNMSTVNHPPVLRVAAGSFPQWATAERQQCLFAADEAASSSGSRPAAKLAIDTGGVGGGSIVQGDYVTRVEACVAGQDNDAEYCRVYRGLDQTESVKPVGLLQIHGESKKLNFGLITGSYNNNTRGGVLRKNISQFVGADTIADNEVDLTTGIFTDNTNSIVGTLDSLRIAGWDFSRAQYDDCSTHSISIETFKSGTQENRRCRDWGNPLSEIYLEALRYFAGAETATPEFSADSYVAGVNQASWSASGILNDANACAECAIVVLSTGLNSFDADNMGSASDLPDNQGRLDVAGVIAKTKELGELEQIAQGGEFIVANANNSSASNVCTTKTLGVNGLAEVQGLCPELPQLQGSYRIAGLSYYARNADIRAGLEGKQSIATYAVALAESLPSFAITANDGSGALSFVPACQSNTDGNASLVDSGWSDCSLSDVSVVQQSEFYSQMLIAWEDSHWGNDYDMDGISSIEYCSATGNATSVRAACPTYSVNGDSPNWGAANSGEIQMRVSVPVAAADNALRFGFIINGSIAEDGPVVNLLRRGGQTINRLNGQSTNTIRWDSVRKFQTSPAVGKLLHNPLWYAAKYGKYNDRNASGTPDLAVEWDTKDTSGRPMPDGLPDNFYPISNPALLVTSLGQIFNDIDGNIVSSSAAAVVANSSAGNGAVFQGLYYPRYELASGKKVSWVGMLQAIFRDDNDNLREDTNSNGVLDDFATDYKVEIFFDDDSGLDETRIRRFSSANNGDTFSVLDTIDLESFKPIWNARNQLAEISNTDVTRQRVYSNLASTGRYIFTSIDTNNNSAIEPDETFDFDALHFPADSTDVNFRYLGLDSSNYFAAPNIVNFVRGEQGISGYRSRAIDFDADGDDEVWRLGDLIHSEPVSVSRPNARYDSRYGDDSYKEFRQLYEKRRQVIYVGANDGMLHAFNAGFFDTSINGFKTTDNNGAVAHPLGSELWAYVPMNLLPHLRWLTDPDYQHVYYMDGSPRVYDVNIFTPDVDHPKGWGTILVAGMRLGGGQISFDPNNDDAGSDSDADNITSRSAYVVMDITNPERPPKLVAELSYVKSGLGAISVTQAGRYSSPPAVTISGDGSGATAEAVLADKGSVSIFCNPPSCGSGYSVGDVITATDDTGVIVGEFYIKSIDPGGKLKTQVNPGFVTPFITERAIKLNTSEIGDGDAAFIADIKYPIAAINIIHPGQGYSSATVAIDGSGEAQANILSATDFGFTTSKPVVVKKRQANDLGSFSDLTETGTNNWLLVMGSGPSGKTALSAVDSDRNAKLLIYDLVERQFVAGFRPDASALDEDPDHALVSHPNSFVGDLALVDWDNDYADDAVYFGIVAGSAQAPDGSLKRLTLDITNPNNSTINTLVDTQNPVFNAPRVAQDMVGNRWVYAGTGRYLSTDDNLSNAKQYFYGVIEDDSAFAVSANAMVDVTNLQVFTDDPSDFATLNYVRECTAPCTGGGSDVSINGVEVESWQDLRNEILKTSGWFRELDLDRELAQANVSSSAARSFGATNMVGPTLLFIEYAPSPDLCAPIGYARRKAIHFQTGTAAPYARSGLGGSFTYDDINLDFVRPDDGYFNSVLILSGDGQGNHDNVEGDGTTGGDKGELDEKIFNNLPQGRGRQGWQEVNINWDIEG